MVNLNKGIFFRKPVSGPSVVKRNEAVAIE